jgi:hypothetical protein
MSLHISEACVAAEARLADIRAGRRPAPPMLEPPYDSPIEWDFAYHLVKFADEHLKIRKQHRVRTPHGNYRLDFLLVRHDGYKIGIECDGKDFHNEAIDAVRDQHILQAGAADTIYRLRGQDIYWRIEATLYLLGQMESWLFSDRGLHNLHTLAWEVRDYEEFDDQIVSRFLEWETERPIEVRVLFRRKAA